LEPNEEKITLIKTEGRVPGDITIKNGSGAEYVVKPFLADEVLAWSLSS
jgi:hypothetical protein